LAGHPPLDGLVHRLAKRPRMGKVLPGRCGRLVRQPGLHKPAGQVLRGAQPLGLPSPPLTQGRGEVQAGAAAQETELPPAVS